LPPSLEEGFEQTIEESFLVLIKVALNEEEEEEEDCKGGNLKRRDMFASAINPPNHFTIKASTFFPQFNKKRFILFSQR
jgi:hypothetical protein